MKMQWQKESIIRGIRITFIELQWDKSRSNLIQHPTEYDHSTWFRGRLLRFSKMAARVHSVVLSKLDVPHNKPSSSRSVLHQKKHSGIKKTDTLFNLNYQNLYITSQEKEILWLTITFTLQSCGLQVRQTTYSWFARFCLTHYTSMNTWSRTQ